VNPYVSPLHLNNRTMNDTTPEIERRQFEIMSAMGSRKRIELACEMYMTARESVLSKLPKTASEREREREFVSKMYGTELASLFFDGEDK
jgi:hypothetical protein